MSGLVNSSRGPLVLLWLLGGSVFLFATVFALKYSGQPLLDLHSFRQTQTALTSFWLAKEGFKFAYETPVGGYPWAIPFEFPLYQYLAALFASSMGVKLEVAGRVLSFAFLVACLVPIKSIIEKLKLSDNVLPILVAVTFSSPVCLYWGRAFMIETAALFFAVASLPFFINVLKGDKVASSTAFFVLFSTLSILQKSTTSLPLLVVLTFVYAYGQIKAPRPASYSVAATSLALAMLMFGVPLLVGGAWTLYTDLVKADNPFGTQLISAELTAWTWGTVSQRLSSDIFVNVLWQRIFVGNLAGPLGLGLFVWALSRRSDARVKQIIWVSLSAGVLPIFLFTNLHLVHDYYQTASTVFLIFGLAVILGEQVPKAFKHPSVVVLLTGLVVICNGWAFSNHYLPAATMNYTRYNSRIMAIAEVLRREVPQGHSFIAFGNDWSSSLAYLANRKSFTVPPFFKQYDDVLRRPHDFVGNAPLGAIVVCSSPHGPSFHALLSFAATQENWHLGVVHTCLVAVRSDVMVRDTTRGNETICEGHVDHVGSMVDGGSGQVVPGGLLVEGWTTLSGATGTAPQVIYVTLTDERGRTSFHAAVRAPRADVAVHFGLQDMQDSGFSSLLDVSALSGRYRVGISRSTGDAFEHCQFSSTVDIKRVEKA